MMFFDLIIIEPVLILGLLQKPFARSSVSLSDCLVTRIDRMVPQRFHKIFDDGSNSNVDGFLAEVFSLSKLER